MSEKRLSQIIADGWDAAVDGRGFGLEHFNATRLCDAAPKLLEALKDVVDRLETCEPDRFEDEEDFEAYHGAIDRGRAAIAEAEGWL